MNKILFTNDDGYESVALHDMYDYVSQKFPHAQKILMAPHIDKSGISHAITIGKPLIFREKETDKFEVEGFPADCTLAGYEIMGMPDLIISGPNFGSNLGQDIVYSGTIAAAREGAFRGIPALAFSFVNEGQDEHGMVHINYDDWHVFLNKWLYGLIQLAKNNKGNIVNVNICTPIGVDLVEGTLGSRYYYNYHRTEKRHDNTGTYFVAIPQSGIDLSKEVEEGSDINFVYQGKNVFSVFSAWPKLKENKTKELLLNMRE